MLKNKRILFVILMVFLMILIPNVAKASEEIIIPDPTIGVEISEIDVTMPTPMIGNKQSSFNDIKVETDGGEELEVVEVIWYKYDYLTGQEEEDAVLVADIAKGFYDGAVGERFEAKELKEGQAYSVQITYRRPWEYSYASEFYVEINGDAGAGDFESDGHGDGECAWDKISCVLGYPKVKIEKNISKVDIKVPTPVIAQKQATIKDVTVKVDDSENLEVIELVWYKYNSETKEYELQTYVISDVTSQFHENPVGEKYEIKKFEENEKYKLEIIYRRPNKYGYSSDLKVKVNGNDINVNSFSEFTAGNVGERGYDWDRVSYEFGTPKKYEPADDTNKESNKDTNLGNDAETNKDDTKKEENTKKEDTTKAGGTIPYTGGEFIIILSAIAVVGLGIYIYRKNKDLKGV